METTQATERSVPWSSREAWWGALALILWIVVVYAVSYLIERNAIAVDPGLFTAITEAGLLVPVWWLVIRRYRVGWNTLGLCSFGVGTLGVGCGLMIMSLLFNAAWASFLAIFDLRAQIDWVLIFAELSSPWWLLLAGIVVAPIVEELFFRGFLFAGLAQRYSWRRAAVISSALFALIHLQPLAIPPIFILGYIFAYLYRRSGSIWPAVVMHVATNALGLGAAYLLSRLTGSG